MNTQLVESLVKVINSLSEEERNFLREKMQPQSDWEKQRSRIIERAKIISDKPNGILKDTASHMASLRNQNKPLSPSATEIIHQMREERDEQLMQACFPQDEE